jgi:hypothetical protein
MREGGRSRIGSASAQRAVIAALSAVVHEKQEEVRQLQERNYQLRLRRGLCALHARVSGELAAHKQRFGATDESEAAQLEALWRDAGCAEGPPDEPGATAVFEQLYDQLERLRPGRSLLELER